jgi:hypothetical protein
MAKLESINYVPSRPVLVGIGVEWMPDVSAHVIPALPQIFWKGGLPWAEANHWAVYKMNSGGVELETVQSLMDLGGASG